MVVACAIEKYPDLPYDENKSGEEEKGEGRSEEIFFFFLLPLGHFIPTFSIEREKRSLCYYSCNDNGD